MENFSDIIRFQNDHELDVVALSIPIFTYVNINGVDEKLLVNFDEIYTHISTLGKGGSGSVKCYQENSTKLSYAIKEIEIFEETNVMDLKIEINTLISIQNKINSDHIVKYFDSFLIKRNGGFVYAIVTEHIEGNSLSNYVNLSIDGLIDINENIVLKIAYWLFDTLSLLHENGYVHRDIKPENIMVDTENNRFVLIDFGTTCSLNKNNEGSIKCNFGEYEGTFQYMAPESWGNGSSSSPRKSKALKLYNNGNRNKKLNLIDVWSAGVTIYYLIEKRFPWNQRFSDGIMKQITDTNYAIKHSSSGILGNIINMALTRDPIYRPDASVIRDFIAKEMGEKILTSTAAKRYIP